MKSNLKLIILLLFVCFNASSLFSQDEERTTITISHISYVFSRSGKIKSQVEIDISNRLVYFRKNRHRRFRKIEKPSNLYLFADSTKLDRVKQISKSISQHSYECLYHNEYGYFRIEIMKYCREDIVHGETFLINTPYECQDEKEMVLA